MGHMTLGRGRRRSLLIAAVSAGLLLLALQALRADAAHGFDTGIYEPDYSSDDPAAQARAFDRTAAARAGFALIYVGWDSVAPQSPPGGFVASDPNSPGYKWGPIDAAVQDAQANGLKPLIAFTRAPSWAEGPGRPSQSVAPAGAWKPNPAAVGDFTRAIATRYPSVRYWQLWAEPNLGLNLSPQFQGRTPVGFDVYRPMLDAFYASLKAVNPANVVISGGTAPFGGLTPSRGLAFQRMQPLTFWRGLLCERVKKKKRKKRKRRSASASAAGCTPPRFDVVAHHPINVGAPTRHALNPDDVSTPDIGKLRRVIRRGVGNKPIWATELWWNSHPPGRGVSLKTQARYLSQSFYILWKQGVGAAFWFELRDLVQTGGPIPTSGLLFHDYSPKPSFQAFAFPFAVERIGSARVRVWGMAPSAGPVSIVRRGHTVKTLAAGGDRVFAGVLHMRGFARLRAVQGSEGSLTAPEFTTKRRR